MTSSNSSGTRLVAVVGDLNGGPISRIQKQCGDLSNIRIRFFAGGCSSFPSSIDHVFYTRFTGHTASTAWKGIPDTPCWGGTGSICQAIKDYAGKLPPPCHLN